MMITAMMLKNSSLRIRTRSSDLDGNPSVGIQPPALSASLRREDVDMPAIHEKP